MYSRLRARFDRRPLQTAVLVACAAALAAYGVASLDALIEWRAFDARIARAGARSSAGSPVSAGWEFCYAESTVTVEVPVDLATLAATERIRTRRVFRSSGWLRQRYITSLVARQSREPFIASLAEELDERALALGITDPDSRLEFYVAAVQAIPYGEVSSEIRLPVEVVSGGSGVCTEKSLLLAELLVNRGYSTVLWVLPTQHHVALGVATSGEGYHRSGYAFIETTRPAWIGECDQVYRAAGPIARRPVMIELGGGRRYDAGAQVEYVLRVLDSARRDSEALGPYGIYAEMVPDAHSDEYADKAQRSAYALRIARWIEASPDRRAEVYTALTADGPRR